MLNLDTRGWLKLFTVALAATIFRLLLQVIVPSSDGNTLSPSAIANAGLVPIAFFIYAFFGYTLLALVFTLIQKGLPGTRIVKGFVFGSVFCFMWIVYLFEPVPFSNPGSMWELIAYPVADGSALIVLGLLLGYFSASSNTTTVGFPKKKNKIVILPIFPLSFLLLRIFGYEILGITSSFITSPIQTLVWATITGFSIGIMYLLLSTGITQQSVSSRAIFFGVVVFGIDLFVFNFFAAIVFNTNFLDLFMRGLIDVISVVIGVVLYEKILKRYKLNG